MVINDTLNKMVSIRPGTRATQNQMTSSDSFMQYQCMESCGALGETRGKRTLTT